jgi:ATP phosphoribosyltransferase regulatory subunit
MNESRLTPEGTRDVLFEASEAQAHIEETLRNFYYCRGFREVRTPGIEFYDVFGRKAQYFPAESMYKLSDSRGRLIVMRPDSTIPMARLVSTKYRSRALPLRLCYDQVVYRTSRQLDGISHEMRQSGVEVIGAGGAKSDLEILKMACDVFPAIDPGLEWRLEIGHAGIYRAVLNALGCDRDESEAILSAAEARSYSALNDIAETYAGRRAAEVLRRLPRLFGGEEIFDEARSLLAGLGSQVDAALDRLEWLYSQFEKLDLAGRIMIDLGMVNQADYYSGIIFRAYTGGAGTAVLSGGRYDHLLEDFGMQAQACGFGVRVDQLAQVLLRHAPIYYARPDMIYAADEDMAEAMEWQNDHRLCLEWSMAGDLKTALADAEKKGCTTLMHYHDGKVDKYEVAHA